MKIVRVDSEVWAKIERYRRKLMPRASVNETLRVMLKLGTPCPKRFDPMKYVAFDTAITMLGHRGVQRSRFWLFTRMKEGSIRSVLGWGKFRMRRYILKSDVLKLAKRELENGKRRGF